ncbi:adenylate kinase [Nematocida sp. AWRm77]|nr:adenylate kinase [Nematocida sp. AWRm77]
MQPSKKGVRILVTGTPGVGKTTLSAYLKEKLRVRVVGISDVIEKKKLYRRKCSVFDTLEYSPGRVKKYLQKKLSETKSYLFDTHDPESLDFLSFDVIIVLTCDLHVLSDRYKERGYSTVKADENIQAEIMEVVYNDAIEYLCSTEAEAGEIIRVCTTENKEPKTLEQIFKEVSDTPKWKEVFCKDK